MINDFIRTLGLLVDPDRFARRRVESAQRSEKTKCDVYPISDRNEPSLKLKRGGTPVPDMGEPHLDRSLPQQNAVKRIAGDQIPFSGTLDRGDRASIGKIEDPSGGGDQRHDAGKMLMAARMRRSGDPLNPSWRADLKIVSNCVAAGVMKVMCPLVDLLGSGFDNLQPPPSIDLDDANVLLLPHCLNASPHRHQRYPVRDEHPQHLLYFWMVLAGYQQQVHEVIGVGQAVAVPQLDRDGTADAEGSDVFSGGLDLRGIGLQPLHERGTTIFPPFSGISV